jgi:futalosine hydrolase
VILAVVATEREQAALLRDVEAERIAIGPYATSARTPAADVVVSGIGPAAAAAATAHALARGDYDVCLSLGICGAFRGTADVGDVVVSTQLVAADLGADSPGGFLSISSLGWDEDTVDVDEELLRETVGRLGDVVTGPVLTVSTVTGTRARADELAARHGAVAEAMEGWGVWEAARVDGRSVVEVRTVSNHIGDRDTALWDFPAAFESLAVVGAKLLGAPWL